MKIEKVFLERKGQVSFSKKPIRRMVRLSARKIIEQIMEIYTSQN
jgi:hypothetical protein